MIRNADKTEDKGFLLMLVRTQHVNFICDCQTLLSNEHADGFSALEYCSTRVPFNMKMKPNNLKKTRKFGSECE